MIINANLKAPVIIMLLLIIMLGSQGGPCSAVGIADMTPVAENEYLRLYINEQDAGIAVLDKRNDHVWYSNPPNWDKDERIAQGTTKNQVGAQLLITYDRGNSEIKRDSYNHSVLLGQFEISPINNGVKVNYTINEVWKPDDYIPQVISQERMETAILSQLNNDKDRDSILRNYTLFMLVEHDGGSRVDIPGLRVRNLSKEQIFGNYTLMPLDESYQARLAESKQLETKIQQLKSKIAALDSDAVDEIAQLEKQLSSLESDYTRIVNGLNKGKADLVWELLNKIADMREDYVRLGLEGIRFDHVKQFINRPTYMLKQTPPFVRQNMANIIKKTGYTPEDVIVDHRMNNVNAPYPNIEVFRISLEYVLDGDNLLVRVPMDEISYPNGVLDIDGNKQTYPLRNISLLPFFGAADMDSEGYIFVPDGSGALIHFNQQPKTKPIYRGDIYGRDTALDPLESASIINQQIYLPVFGMISNNHGFLAIIEEGEAFGTIVADIAGNRYSYSIVYPEFTVLNRGRLGLAEVGYINVYQSRPYQGEIRIRYKFLAGSEANYMGMARYYRECLIDKYDLNETNTAGSLPFFVDIIGSVSVIRPVSGVSRSVMLPLTTFDQVQTIVEELLAEGINNIRLRYIGMLSGGIKHRFPNVFATEECLGTQQDFHDLLSFVRQNQIEMYPHVDFMEVYDNRLFSGFSTLRDAAKLLDGSPVRIYSYDLATGERSPSPKGYLLSPRRFESVITQFMRNFQQYDIGRLSLANFGTQLYSDFGQDSKQFIDRQQSVKILQQQMERLTSENRITLMVDGGNAFTLPYVSKVVNAPMETSGHAIISERVPFVPIVLRGLYEFAGPPLNLSDNIRRDVLRAIEVGAGIRFIWSYTDSSALKETEYDNLYALNYKNWLQQAAEVYKEVNSVAELLDGERIINHRKLCENVYETTFANNYTVIVNYNQYDVTVNGIDIKAEDYKVLTGGR